MYSQVEEKEGKEEEEAGGIGIKLPTGCQD